MNSLFLFALFSDGEYMKIPRNGQTSCGPPMADL